MLNNYEHASRQQLNRGKTSIFFSKNTHTETRTHVLTMARVNSTQCYEKYLGLPVVVGRNCTRAFQVIQSRVWERLQRWNEKFLSQVGKEVLLKAVIQAIPTHTMSIFQLPKSLCRKLNSFMMRFWWGHKDNLSKAAWMIWEKMSHSKEVGGLGVRDLETFNQALLAK